MLWLLPILALADPVPDAETVVARYRDALVLADAVPTLPEGQRRDAPVLGKMLFTERRTAEEALSATLLADVPRQRSDKGRELATFLDWLEEDAALRDGDRLAFLALLERLDTALEAAPAGKHRDRLLARIREDRAAVDTVEAAYRDEMRTLLGRLRTRGMTLTREKWQSYLDAVRVERPVEELFARHAADLSLVVPGTRGLKDNAQEIYGTSMPPKTFVLTFDDGPHEEHTPAVLDALAAADVPAVFFQVGENAEAHPELTVDVVDGGHLLGSHSWSHANLPKLSDAGLDEQLDKAFDVLETESGVDVVLFRPPYGARDGRVLQAITDRSTRAYLWNVDSMDWADPIPESIAQTVLDQVRERDHGVILLHDVHAQTVEALPLILDLLEKEGVKLVLWDGEAVHGDVGSIDVSDVDAGLYGESWAVVIGINQYERWPRLAYAVHDAEGVRDALVDNFGFAEDHVITLFDGEATRDRILEVLGDELPAQVEPDDRVFVFYAGHGATRALPMGSERGFIVPVDADTEKLQSTAISMSALGDVHEALAAKHVMFVMDACYSGIALTRAGGYTGDPRRYLQEVTRRNARQILTAGGADEQVTDHGPGGHSIFTWTLLQGMSGPADLNGDGFITASELSSFVAPRVSSLSAQTPAFGNLVGSQGGEFVFTLEPDQALLSDLSGTRTDADDLARARQQLAAENEELLKELAKMQAQLAELERGRGAAEDDPSVRAEALHAEGIAAFRKGDLAGAYSALRKAAELDGSHPEIVNNVGYVLQELDRHEEAKPWFERAIELDPERAVAYLNLGDTLAALEEREGAEKAYRRYLEMVPESPVRGRVEGYLGSP